MLQITAERCLSYNFRVHTPTDPLLLKIPEKKKKKFKSLHLCQGHVYLYKKIEIVMYFLEGILTPTDPSVSKFYESQITENIYEETTLTGL